MSAIARFKEYFGMAPVAAYDDEYLDDYDRPVHHDVRAPRGIRAAASRRPIQLLQPLQEDCPKAKRHTG